VARVLLATTVYNGRSFVPRCVASAARAAEASSHDVDVLFLDDASPEPGFGDDLVQWCRDAGVDCYRSPRNLGIVRNVNLGLLRALDAGYDHVIISNSDVVYPLNLVDQLVAVADSDESIGSVTAWSTNVSAYSMPNLEPDAFVADQEGVDWISASLAGQFGTAAMDVPAGISFCILMPRRVIEDVGLMDPIYGKGYCEESDWSLRSLAHGWRVVLAPGVFVYHQGRGSTLEAGLVSGGHSTVPENEAIIDLRYPLFRSQIDAFLSSDLLPTAIRDGSRRIVADAARQFGWQLDLSWLAPSSADPFRVVCSVDPSGPSRARAVFRGFTCDVPIRDDESVPAALVRFFGGEPTRVGIKERGVLASRLFAEFGGVDDYRYPERV
jgi:GT2 family glycosyltransferase